MFTCCPFMGGKGKTEMNIQDDADEIVPTSSKPPLAVTMKEEVRPEALAAARAAERIKAEEKEQAAKRKAEEEEAARRREQEAREAEEREARRKADLEAEAIAREEAERKAKEDAAADARLRELEGIEWMITLKKSPEQGRPLGITVIPMSPTFLSIEKAEGGALALWNQENPDQQGKVGDAIVSVNGVRDNATGMVAELSKNNTLELELKRILEYSFSIDASKHLGVSLDPKTSAVLKLDAKGCFCEYNRSCAPGRQISKGDVLKSVDGISGDAKDVLEALKNASGTVTLVFKRGD